MEKCGCGSYAINLSRHGRDGTDTDLCDVCYWKKRGERFDYATKELEHFKQVYASREERLTRLETVFDKHLSLEGHTDFNEFYCYDFLRELLYEYNR
jgi:hypothetical protein